MEFSDNRPIFRHICDLAAERIISGEWREGERIPSVREFAVELQVNPNTVMRAYDILQTEGLIASSRGVGYSVTEGASTEALSRRRKEFIEGELRSCLRTMRSLGITYEELKQYCNENE